MVSLTNVEANGLVDMIKDFFGKTESAGGSSCSNCSPELNPVGAYTCEILKEYDQGAAIRSVPPSNFTSDLAPICKEVLLSWGISDSSKIDDCQRSGENRYASDYISLSPRELRRTSRKNNSGTGWKLASYEMLDKRLNEIYQKSVGMKLSCCGQDLECRRLIDTVQLFYCDNPEARANKNLPDSCSDLAYFNVSLTTIEDLQKLKDHFPSTSPLQIKRIGEIVISPYYQEIGNEITWMDSDLTIAHEYGHACRMVKLAQSLNSQEKSRKESAIFYLNSISGQERDCSLPRGKIEFYRSIAENSGEVVTPTIIDCVASLGLRGEGVCENNCPYQALDESYANLIATIAYPNWAFPNFCASIRDSQHPFGMDIYECLAQHSPNFRQIVKNYWGCP